MKRLCIFILLSLVIAGFATPVHAETAKDWLIKGYDLFQLGKYDEALEAYDKALEIDPQSDRAWDMKGELYKTLERYEEAIEAYDQDLQNDGPDNPDNYWSLSGKGDCLLNLERYEEAIDAYSQALEIDSTKNNASDIQVRLANSLKNLGRYEEAVKILDQLLENDPDDFRIWEDKGDCLYNLGRNEEAIEAYDHSLELNPESNYAQDMKEEIRNQDVKENIPVEADTPAGQKEEAAIEIEEPAEEQEYEAAMDAPAKETDTKAQIQDPPVNGCVKYDSGTTTSYSCDCSNYATMCQKKYFYQEKDGKLEKIFETEAFLPEGYFHGCCGDKWIEVPIDLPTEEPTEAPTEKPVEEEQVIENSGEIAVGSIFTGVFNEGSAWVEEFGPPLYTKDATIVINWRDEMHLDGETEIIPVDGTITFSDDFTFGYGREVPSGTPLHFHGGVYHYGDGTVSIVGSFNYPGEVELGDSFGYMLLPDDAW